MAYNTNDYDNEPVHYCQGCLSLNIKELEGIQFDICGHCGNPESDHTSIEEWNRMYIQRYGKPFHEINNQRLPQKETPKS